MSDEFRTWPDGTVKFCKVIFVVHTACDETILCVARGDDGRDEGFTCLQAYRGREITVCGDRGTITFVEGGPAGGGWRYAPWTGVAP